MLRCSFASKCISQCIRCLTLNLVLFWFFFCKVGCVRLYKAKYFPQTCCVELEARQTVVWSTGKPQSYLHCISHNNKVLCFYNRTFMLHFHNSSNSKLIWIYFLNRPRTLFAMQINFSFQELAAPTANLHSNFMGNIFLIIYPRTWMNQTFSPESTILVCEI